MFERICLVHFHEIGLKGRNRSQFERRLRDNIGAALVGLPVGGVERIASRVLVQVTDPEKTIEVAKRIAEIPGVQYVSPGYRVPREPAEMERAALLAIRDAGPFATFRVESRRSNTDYPEPSMEMNVRIGAALQRETGAGVNLKAPDVTVRVAVVQGSTYISSAEITGVGGLPVGTAGRVVSLLSAGIDSPVASWRLARRGAVIVGVHFSGRPQTSDASERLVDEIGEKLARTGGLARIYVVPFGDLQKEISLASPPDLRVLLYRRFDRGIGTRNVLVVGTGPEAHALRHHLESIRHLGYKFKGFIDTPSAAPSPATTSGEVMGTLDTLFLHARKQFVDEIFFTSPCERGIVQKVLEQARILGIDLRIVPDMYDGLAWNSPIEYIGQFPTIPLHCGRTPDIGLAFKRAFDIVFSTALLMLLSPLLLLIAIAVKFDSPGPVFYFSERIGKKGRVFRCIKFRTMIRDAEKKRAVMMHLNEREGVLFNISDDPRITRLGRFLRKYSLDELPQFFNVLSGDMSVVGPRPPIGSEVREYKLSHLRRLDVTPGITGLWQVQARQDPSFDSYISLDVTYIENWSIWLDFYIILRTIGVVFDGTGT